MDMGKRAQEMGITLCGCPAGEPERGLSTRDLYVDEGSEMGISLHRGPVENHGGGGRSAHWELLRDR
jgi:hypothetical protein